MDGFKEETRMSRLNGQDAVNLSVKKRSCNNIIAISNKVDKIIKKAQVKWPQGIKITKVRDKFGDIELRGARF
ncbi:MAG: hypothetical protein KJ630_13190 [Proteobacteria bacterium]|nr:hypothetical protein [Pseudomonadota bacterium]